MTTRRSLLAVAPAALALALAGCVSNDAAHDLTDLFDTEAADILTNQEDVTEEVCGASSKCAQALRSDQALILRFDWPSDAEAEADGDDELVRDVYLVRWEPDAPIPGRAVVINLIETANRSE